MLLMILLGAGQVGVDGIPPMPFDVEGVGVVGLVVLIGLGFATGRLYTRGQVKELQESHVRELERVEEAHERELERRDHDTAEWRAAHRISEVGRVEEREHNAAFVRDVADPLKAFLEGFREVAKERRG